MESAAPERAGAEHLLALLESVGGGPLHALSVDTLAFGRGPGAFTSVRTTVSLAHGLALSTGLALVPVSTLEAIATAAIDTTASDDAPVLVVTDARLGEVYAGLYAPVRSAATVGARAIIADALLSPADVGAWAASALLDGPAGLQRSSATNGLTVAGNALSLHADGLALGALERVAPRDNWLLLSDCVADAAAVARAAACRLAQGEPGVPPEEAPPIYLRERVADIPARMRTPPVL